MEGRQISIETTYDGITFTDDAQVTKFKQLLPRNPAIGRTTDIVQFFSDRGVRTVAVADLRPYVKRKRVKKPAVVEDEDD